MTQVTKLQVLKAEMHRLRSKYYLAKGQGDEDKQEKLLKQSTILNVRVSRLLDAEKGD